ncbi:MAG: hypothetical protein Q7I99_05805 [Acholeplasmataceae bacterium]|nr:hypothetical protein [Acholeplasmataceae bacterium]
MNYKIVDTFPNPFFTDKKAPLISIYQETSRHLPDNKRDALVFKNLIKAVESSLKEKYSKDEIQPLLEMFSKIENESTFWSHTIDGIALFATLDECIIYHLKAPTHTLAVVADSFHIKPLIQYHQFMQNYQILDLDGQSFQILNGNPYQVERAELGEGIQTTKDAILGTELTDAYQTHGTYGGASGKSTFHGHGGKKDEIEIDLERFFRRVDSIVNENISKVSKLPLILLAPIEHHSLFIGLSSNQYLEEKGIAGTFDTLEKDELVKQLTSYAKNTFNKKVEKSINQFHQFRSDEKSSDQLIDILSAVVDGRVETLLIEENKIIPGKIDPIHKKMIIKKLSDPEFDDILDDLAQFTLDRSGEVFILSKDKMPTESGIAAIFRY